MAKDEFGHFLNPEFNFGNLWDLTEGLGYLVKLREDTDLIWCVERDEGAANHNQNSVYNIQPSLLPAHRPTDENMSLLVIGDNILKGEVGVFANGNLVGSAVIQEGICGIAVWGDDSSTPEIDGALPGDKLEIQYHSSSNKQSSEAKDYSPRYDVISGTGLYETDSFMAIKLLDVAETPSEFGIVSVHPNPFNSSTNLSYYLPEAGNINLSLFDLSGREVTEIISKKVEAGLHSANIDGTDLSSGVYVASLSFNGINVMQKVVLVR